MLGMNVFPVSGVERGQVRPSGPNAAISASSRSPDLPAVHLEHDRGCQDLQVAVHRVQILHPLWDLRERREFGLPSGREKSKEPGVL